MAEDTELADLAIAGAAERRAAGLEYIAKLVELQFPIEFAAWIFVEADVAMRLALISPAADDVGSLEIYETLFKAYDASVLPKEINPFDVDLHGSGKRTRDQPSVRHPECVEGWEYSS